MGQEVFSNHNYEKAWHGKQLDKECPNGIYFYDYIPIQ